MRFRTTALSFVVLSVALCAIGRADDDHDHDQDNDHRHFNHKHADRDDDCDDCSGTPKPMSNAGGLYLVQGAPGRDLSHSFYPTYPIDVLVNDTSCLVQNAPFPSVQGAFLEQAGAYDLKISPANAAAPCTNAYVREVQAVVNAGQATYVVVALSMQSTLTTYNFNLPLSPVQRGKARVVIADAADAPMLDPGASTSPLSDGASLASAAQASPASASSTAMSAGQSIPLVVPAEPFTGNIYYAGTNQVAVGPISDVLQSRSTEVYFIVGSDATGSLQMISSRIPDVF